MSIFFLDEHLVPVEVSVDDQMIRVSFRGGLELATPVARFPRLHRASPEQRRRWRLIGRGDGIHWPDVDEDISVSGLFKVPKRDATSKAEEIPALVGELLRVTRRLNDLFKGRPFTPDGHLVGSIGEVVAEYIYDLNLEPCSTPQIDAQTKDGRTVQIKLTGEKGNSFGLRWSNSKPSVHADLLVCLRLDRKGFREVYNGPFPIHLLEGRRDTTNGQIGIAAGKLAEANPRTLPEKNSFANINRWFETSLADVA